MGHDKLDLWQIVKAEGRFFEIGLRICNALIDLPDSKLDHLKPLTDANDPAVPKLIAAILTGRIKAVETTPAEKVFHPSFPDTLKQELVPLLTQEELREALISTLQTSMTASTILELIEDDGVVADYVIVGDYPYAAWGRISRMTDKAQLVRVITKARYANVVVLAAKRLVKVDTDEAVRLAEEHEVLYSSFGDNHHHLVGEMMADERDEDFLNKVWLRQKAPRKVMHAVRNNRRALGIGLFSD